MDRLRLQMDRLAQVSSRTLAEVGDLAAHATQAHAGHAEMEEAIRSLNAVAIHLQEIARTFAAEA